MNTRIFYISIFVYSLFVYSISSYARQKYFWLVDGVYSSQIIYNFKSYALGGPINSVSHKLRITREKPDKLSPINRSDLTVVLNLPTSCKIGLQTINQNNIAYLVNGTKYLNNNIIDYKLFYSDKGARTSFQFLNVPSKTHGNVYCIGGYLTLSY